jgi:hypothetical protein
LIQINELLVASEQEYACVIDIVYSGGSLPIVKGDGSKLNGRKAGLSRGMKR